MGTTSQIVEFLRAKMIRVATEKQCLTDPEVVAVSQLLDRFIVQAQRVSSLQLATVSTVVEHPLYSYTPAQPFAFPLQLRAVHSRN